MPVTVCLLAASVHGDVSELALTAPVAGAAVSPHSFQAYSLPASGLPALSWRNVTRGARPQHFALFQKGKEYE